jgi:hypothetical protein
MADLVSLFWKQLDWIQPQSYIADGNAFLIFVTLDKDLFIAVRQAFSELVPSS